MTTTWAEEVAEYFVWRDAMVRRADWLLAKYAA